MLLVYCFFITLTVHLDASRRPQKTGCSASFGSAVWCESVNMCDSVHMQLYCAIRSFMVVCARISGMHLAAVASFARNCGPSSRGREEKRVSACWKRDDDGYNCFSFGVVSNAGACGYSYCRSIAGFNCRWTRTWNSLINSHSSSTCLGRHYARWSSVDVLVQATLI